MPLRVLPFDERKYYVLNGTPTDCVHLAISGLFEEEHDMVVSGINDGSEPRRRRAVFGHRRGRDRRPLPRTAGDRACRW